MTVDMEKDVLINHTTGKEYSLKPIGDVSEGRQGVLPWVELGGWLVGIRGGLGFRQADSIPV